MNRNAVCLLIFSFAVYRVSSQLVLDDIADEFEETVDNVAKTEPTDPYTKMLQWGVDNMDRASVAEQAKAVREVQFKQLSSKSDFTFNQHLKLVFCVAGSYETESI
jgi:hypothetical protein